MEVIGPDASRRLALDTTSPQREQTRWKHKFGEAALIELERGLADKSDQGLEMMRRARVPSARMFDVAEYYYKVRSSRS
jgi:hypothetical protein